MRLRDYGRVLARRWWIFLLCAFVAGAAAYVYSKQQEVLFRSTAKIYVTPANNDYGLTLVVQNLIIQYSQQLKSDRFIDQVNQKLRLDLPREKLRQRIAVSGTADNLAILVSADDPFPDQAQAIARTLSTSFIENHAASQEKNRLEPRDRIRLEIFDEPQPGEFSQPKTRTNVLAALILGLLIGGIIAFGLEFLDDTIKDAEDVERFIALPAIGSIPRITPAEARRLR
jgi:capsular polysaccharide biosynthesis protein